MMKNLFKYAILLVSAWVMSSCIENDLSYPNIVAEISSFVVDGQESVKIDNETRTVSIVLDENADISRLKVVGYSFSNDAEMVGEMPKYLDLRQEFRLTLRIYRDFEWTITATQPIDRYINVDNQIGEAVFDVETKTAHVYVTDRQDLMKVRFNSMKLEPDGSVIKTTVGYVNGERFEADCRFPMVLDCVVARFFYVEYQGEMIEWQVKVLQKAVELELDSVEPWACFANVSGMTNGKGNPVVEYRRTVDTEWITYPAVIDGTKLSARIRGLEPETEYAVRLFNGETATSEAVFTTEAAPQLENLGFDDWYEDGKVWMPNLNAGVQIWDTANPGSAAIGVSPTAPESDVVVSGKAVRMETMQVNILGIKKLAAGNIYTGKFDKLAGLGAELDWGVPFGARPLAVRGYYKYSPKVIDIAEDKDYKDKLGQMDECQIQIFLAEWDKPFHVNSAKKQFVDRDNASVIAFSEFCSSEESGEYATFTLPIVYNDRRTPTYIVMSGCASRYGNFFCGGLGSLLYIDEFELVYDPDELTDEEFAQVFSKIGTSR